MNQPLVSVICTCYNHARFILETLTSVYEQSYERIELIVIDNGSVDDSVQLISQWVEKSKPGIIPIKTLFHSTSLNYCRSFNTGLAMITGKYVVDLSGDDVLFQEHIASAVATLENHPGAVYFSNALLQKENHAPPTTFYPVNEDGELLGKVKSGDIYLQVIQRTVVCAPTLVIPYAYLVEEGGYDEGLSYEDFDIIVRLARKHPFIFKNHIGVKKRILSSSFSAQQYRIRNSVMLPSTLKVCRKIRQMNRDREENQALAFRIMFECKHALASANFDVASALLDLAKQIEVSSFRYRLFRLWAYMRLDLSLLYRGMLMLR